MINKKILWIAPFLPYADVPHAGGKIFYFYLTKLIEKKKYDVRLLAFYEPKELEKFTLGKLIQSDLFCYHNKGIKRFCRRSTNFLTKINPFNKYAGFLSKYVEKSVIKKIKEYKCRGYIPDVIILEWTQVVLLAPKIKSILPKTKIISIEEDVTLLSYKRRIALENNFIRKTIAKMKFKNIEKSEIKALNFSNLVIVNNEKDFNLLIGYDIDVKKIKQWVPYFDNYSDVKLFDHPNSVIFYGAMSRKENYLSAIWFLDNVKPLVKDNKIKYIFIGNNPPDSLKKYESEDVCITGYVKDIRPYLANAICMVAPLILGAGIKIKVLEAFSSGIPVLTNDIGIEGIPAENGKDFLFCKMPTEYANDIDYLINNNEQRINIGKNAKKFILDNFNYNESAEQFIDWIDEI